MIKKAPFIFLGVLLLFVLACRKDHTDMEDFAVLDKYLNLPINAYNYSNPNLPIFYANQFITIQNNTPADNPTTNWGATLGRVLFYDKQLSIDQSISCASCHQQAKGFTDTTQFSIGLNGQQTERHSMALGNAVYYLNGRFFWDERAATLEEQVLIPIQDPIEMGMSLELLEERIQSSEYYPILFRRAFGEEEINRDRIAKALAQFIRSMISYESKFDEGRASVNDIYQDFPNFTNQENHGKTLFTSHSKVNCFSCHNTEAFITDNPRNNGLTSVNEDIGVSIHTQNTLDEGKFKAPSLKNVALRSRFMHDGRLASLNEVVEHYNSRIRSNPNLDSHLIDVSTSFPVTMNLTPIEVDALIAFLHTLTDEKFITSPKYSDPFK